MSASCGYGCTSSLRHTTMMHKRARKGLPCPWTLTLVIAATTVQTEALVATTTSASRTAARYNTQLHYRYTDVELPPATRLTDGADHFKGTDFADVAERLVVRKRRSLPTWLRRSQAHLAEVNLDKLKEAMRNSHLSDSEAGTVLQAIHESSDGDLGRTAGAADFCLILVEAMEMGVPALVAATFHYNKAVAAREGGWSPREFWQRHEEFDPAISIGKKYGDHAASIERDAARLKKAEMVANSVKADNESLKGLFLAETRDWRALAIRCAACLYRLRGILDVHGTRQALSREEMKVAKDALHVFSPLACRLGMHRLKNEIEGAAFRVLYPRQYETVTSISGRPQNNGETLRTGMRNLLSDISKKVELALLADETFAKHARSLKVMARVKEPFSLWKKMLRMNTRHIIDIPDALALRVIVDAKKQFPDEDEEVSKCRDRAMCYSAQQICQRYWNPLPDSPQRFKDYILEPKANGYQSLHYTAVCANWEGRDWPIEIQVRTSEMHHVAEFGLAAHWDYKEQAKGIRTAVETSRRHKYDHSTDAYLKSVQDWHWHRSAMNGGSPSDHLRCDPSAYSANGKTLEAEAASSAALAPREQRYRDRTERLAPYIEAFSAAKREVEREQLFVFLSSSDGTDEGKLVELPNGACVIDALRLGEEELGVDVDWGFHKDSSGQRVPIIRNGVTSSITDKLSNGDVVTIPRRRSKVWVP